jgi:hypothetical protein
MQARAGSMVFGDACDKQPSSFDGTQQPRLPAKAQLMSDEACLVGFPGF